jgi:hypothetical protein
MIDSTYGHLVLDSDEYVRGLLDAYDGTAAKEAPWDKAPACPKV